MASWLMTNPLGILKIATVLCFLAAVFWQHLKRRHAERECVAQRAIIRQQEQTIAALEESLKNAEIKRRHDEVVKSISDDALRERMQHESYYRD